MFGTLKPHTCRMGCAGRREYATFYCGLCKSLGDHFGQLTRATLTYDAVFLALVADGLVEEGAGPDRCRCPILPVTFRPTVAPDSPAMRYAAAMQILLSDQWLADRALDGKTAARAARPLLSGKVATARTVLADLGISLADLDGFEDRQKRVEVPGAAGPLEAAEPTAAALELVFSRMALLPGVTEEARTGEAREALGAFGRHLGTVIYLTDALDDLEKDHVRGDFNPCLGLRAGVRPRDDRPRVSWPRVELCWRLLHDALAALDELSATLPLRRHRDLVRSVVAVELPRAAREAATRAHAYAKTEAARWRDRSIARRVLAAAVTAFVLIWVWLSSLPAFAKGPKRPVRDAGAGDASAAPPPEQWNPQLPPPRPTASARAPASATTSEPSPRSKPGGSAAPGGTDPTSPGTKPGGDPGGTTSGGTSKPGGGGGCSNPCSGCGSGSGSGGGGNPCSSCGDCCGACRQGDCGCCKVCDLCNSCNSCCNACNGCGGK